MSQPKNPKIVHNRKNCIGCHACIALAPQTWKINDIDGKSDLIDAKEKRGLFVGEIFEHDLEQNRKAARACPMQIIKIEDPIL